MSDAPAAGYGPVILDHFRRPRNRRRLDDASARGEANNPLCGDTVRFAIRLREDRVVEAAFEAEACAICTAAASLLTELALGLTPEQLMGMEAAELEVALKTEIRPARKRCASLPLEAARSAVISITQPDRP